MGRMNKKTNTNNNNRFYIFICYTIAGAHLHTAQNTRGTKCILFLFLKYTENALFGSNGWFFFVVAYGSEWNKIAILKCVLKNQKYVTVQVLVALSVVLQQIKIESHKPANSIDSSTRRAHTVQALHRKQ